MFIDFYLILLKLFVNKDEKRIVWYFYILGDSYIDNDNSGYIFFLKYRFVFV